MIAIDTNLLVYAHRSDATWHGQATDSVRQLAEAPGAWAIPWPCVHEFLAIVTHPGIFDPPTSMETALEQVQAWLQSPSLVLLSETPAYASRLFALLRASAVRGPRVHDARVAALCLLHGVDELWTADRDFGRFPELKVRNPLMGS